MTLDQQEAWDDLRKHFQITYDQIFVENLYTYEKMETYIMGLRIFDKDDTDAVINAQIKARGASSKMQVSASNRVGASGVGSMSTNAIQQIQQMLMNQLRQSAMPPMRAGIGNPALLSTAHPSANPGTIQSSTITSATPTPMPAKTDAQLVKEKDKFYIKIGGIDRLCMAMDIDPGSVNKRTCLKFLEPEKCKDLYISSWQPNYGTGTSLRGDDNARRNGMRDGDLYLHVDLMRASVRLMKKGRKKKAVVIDKKHFDRLILAQDKKEAILDTLKQHETATTIFDKWGLGETIEYGRGMNMLFFGPPGTGKTFAANCIAKSLNKELLSMTNAELQSSTPGEAERNIIAAFEEAKSKKKVLLLDECDSLLFSRKNVGMIIGSEINCLLREIEKFEGVCILTTNRLGELDEALQRRLSLILKFPEPDLDIRRDIWKSLIPKKMPLGKDVSIDDLAQFELSGGLIKNVILNAARFAAGGNSKRVNKEHFDRALKAAARGRKAFEDEESSGNYGRLMGTGGVDKIRG